MTDKLQSLKQRILDRDDLPAHIAIIMDGNGRWAKERNLPRLAGHNEGVNSVREVVRACGELGIEVLTLYTFSVENWSRPPSEVSALMQLLVKTIRREVDELMENNVKLNVVGAMGDLPPEPRRSMESAIERTANNTGLNLNLALSYGGRMEILDAVKSVCRDVEAGELSLDALDECVFRRYLYTADFPDPDLLIRTSGESRLSNFLLWQIAYTEIYITSVYWPSFRRKELYQAILNYQSRERRYGKVSEQVNSQPVFAEHS